MKKLTIIPLLATLLFVGCTADSFENTVQNGEYETLIELKELTATFADEETRTYVDAQRYQHWNADDQLSVFFGDTANSQYEFQGNDGDVSGVFKPVNSQSSNQAQSQIIAAYPYDSYNYYSGAAETFIIKFATEQLYAEKSFGKGANTMVAVTSSTKETNLEFKNVCGFLKLKLYGDNVTVKDIRVESNDSSVPLYTGELPISFVDDIPAIAWDKVQWAYEKNTYVKMNCGESGVKIGSTSSTATEFWFAIPPRTFSKGIKVLVQTTDGKVFEKSTSNSVNIERNCIQPMNVLKVIPGIPSNQIWYTTKDNWSTTPYNSSLVVSSNTEDSVNECWVMTFATALTELPNQAFQDRYTLTSLAMPNSITSIGANAFAGCTALTSITLSNKLETIGYYGFNRTSALTEINIPQSVTSIGDYAFADAYSDLTVTFNSTTPPTLGSGVFGSRTNLVIKVPSSAVTTYKAEWSAWKDYIVSK